MEIRGWGDSAGNALRDFVGGWSRARGVGRLEELVEFGDQLREPLVVLLFGDLVTKILDSLFGSLV